MLEWKQKKKKFKCVCTMNNCHPVFRCEHESNAISTGKGRWCQKLRMSATISRISRHQKNLILTRNWRVLSPFKNSLVFFVPVAHNMNEVCDLGAADAVLYKFLLLLMWEGTDCFQALIKGEPFNFSCLFHYFVCEGWLHICSWKWYVILNYLLKSNSLL